MFTGLISYDHLNIVSSAWYVCSIPMSFIITCFLCLIHHIYDFLTELIINVYTSFSNSCLETRYAYLGLVPKEDFTAQKKAAPRGRL